MQPLVEVIGITGTLCQLIGTSNVAKCYGSLVLLAYWCRSVLPSLRGDATDIAEAQASYRALVTNATAHAEDIDGLHGWFVPCPVQACCCCASLLHVRR